MIKSARFAKVDKCLKNNSSFFAVPIDQSEKILIIYSIVKEEKMKKVEKVKKVVKTKATLVKELEQVVKVDKGFLNSLERANAETIRRLIDICS